MRGTLGWSDLLCKQYEACPVCWHKQRIHERVAWRRRWRRRRDTLRPPPGTICRRPRKVPSVECSRHRGAAATYAPVIDWTDEALRLSEIPELEPAPSVTFDSISTEPVEVP